MSHSSNDRRNRERPVSCATLDRRQQKPQKRTPQRLPKRDPTRGARVLPRRTEPLPGVPARPPER